MTDGKISCLSYQNKMQEVLGRFPLFCRVVILHAGENRMQCSGACPLQQIHGFGSVSIGRILYKLNMETYFGSSPISPARYYLVMLIVHLNLATTSLPC